MASKLISINKVKSNPKNPRLIKDYKYKILLESLKTSFWMMEARPIVVDENMTVLGGNQRLKACQELKLKEVWVEDGSKWTKEQQAEFIIKDNTSFGEWDYNMLANEWDVENLIKWGMDMPYGEDELEEMANPMNIDTENVFATELDRESNYIVLKFNTDIDWLQAKTLFKLQTETARRANGKEWSKGIGRVLDGVKAINMLTDEN